MVGTHVYLKIRKETQERALSSVVRWLRDMITLRK